MKDVVIVSACRTAIGAFGGTLRDTPAATLASITMDKAVDRSGIDPELIDDIIIVRIKLTLGRSFPGDRPTERVAQPIGNGREVVVERGPMV